MFKPFIFVENLKPLKETTSPSYGADDPVKRKPRFQSKPDRKHQLFVKHQLVGAIIECHKVPSFPQTSTWVGTVVFTLDVLVCRKEERRSQTAWGDWRRRRCHRWRSSSQVVWMNLIFWWICSRALFRRRCVCTVKTDSPAGSGLQHSWSGPWESFIIRDTES